VIAPDLRGFGQSSKPMNGYDKKMMAQDIHALAQSLGYQHEVVVGHDIGLTVAYAYAAQYSNEVERIVFIDAFLPGVGDLEDRVAVKRSLALSLLRRDASSVRASPSIMPARSNAVSTSRMIGDRNRTRNQRIFSFDLKNCQVRLPPLADLFLFRFLGRRVRVLLASSLKIETSARTARAAKANPCQPNGASPCSITIMFHPDFPAVQSKYFRSSGMHTLTCQQ
jgi:pimeloyl-ACP methyl ester carboxylesterase